MKRRALVISVIALCLSGLGSAKPDLSKVLSRVQASAWVPIGPPGGDVVALARNPKSPQELFAVTYYGQAFRSADNGAKWSRIAFFFSKLGRDVACDPVTPTTVYVLDEQWLWKSTDSGATFAIVDMPDEYIKSSDKFAIHPTDPRIIYVASTVFTVGAYRPVVYKTVDGGETWSKTVFRGTDTFAEARGLVISAKNPAVVYYCGSYTGDEGEGVNQVCLTTDSGATWRDVTPEFLKASGSTIDALAVDPQNPGKVFLGCRTPQWKGVARSSDYCATWLKQSSPASFETEFIVFDKAKPAAIYAGGQYRSFVPAVFKSVDGGKKWTVLKAGLSGDPQDLLIAGSTIHVATSDGVFISVNAGAEFKRQDSGLNAADVEAFAFTPTPSNARSGAAGIFYAAGGTGGFKSIDGGRRWTRLDALSPYEHSGFENLAVAAGDPNRIYMSTRNDGLIGSKDGGKTFDCIFADVNTPGRMIPLVDPRDPDRVLVAGSVETGGKLFMGVLLSSDGGKRWTKIKIRNDENSIAAAAAIAPSDPNTIYAIGETAAFAPFFYKTTNGGASWTPITVPAAGRFRALAVAPESSKTLYAGGISGNARGVYKSTDAGLSWIQISSISSYCDFLVINPLHSEEIVAAGFWVLHSKDGGRTWTDISWGLPHYIYNSLAMDPVARKIYIAPWGSGICRRAF